MSQYNPFSLSGKTILVTGASSGIGAETAVECSRLGATVILTGRNQDRLQEVQSRLDTSFSQGHRYIVADLSMEDDIANLVTEINQIDGLVNNAGVNRVKPVPFIKQEDLDYIFQNNTFPGVLLTQMLLKKKKLGKNSSIVFTSSVSSFFNAPGRALYSSSKAALTSFMRSFAVELANRNIRANAVHPGMIETGFIHKTLTNEEIEKDMAKYPLKRYGRPEEVAWAIIYLLSDASAWVTGSSLVIDGGFMLI
ncbi:MAG: SDR family oxidoreductase [Bacteroidales bacterium]|nr:SDR family oxidoreductase [Bacteroidales bacterium]